MRFRGELRGYQHSVLRDAALDGADGRLHIVAPPGAGKTVLGLELIRHLGRRAVVFAPTTTVREQWRRSVGRFVDTDADVAATVSGEPDGAAPITVLTYQRIATPDHADQDFREAADRLWADVLVEEGHEPDVRAARARIARLRTDHPAWATAESRRFRRELRRRMLREDPRRLRDVLHPRAVALVDDLVGVGVGTVVLDECHHLLDYWALVVTHLVARLDEPMVVGLTATPPEPDSRVEEENYARLLGDVDIEIPVPALVREGVLAPYRDLVAVVPPTPAEREYLARIDREFVAALDGVVGTPAFWGWLHTELSGRDDDEVAAWARLVAGDAGFAFPAARVARDLGLELSPALRLPAITAAPATLDDWADVLERYALRVLVPSDDPEHHRALRALRSALKPFGLTLSERGLRRGRSPVDRLLALSDAKAEAAVDILRLEHEALGDRLRAAVVCDYDREPGRALPAGEGSASSATGVHAVLSEHPDLTSTLRPVLLTARSVAVAADVAADVLAAARAVAPDLGGDLRHRDTGVGHVVELVGGPGEWSPARYVPLVTRLLADGHVRCVVGTRGLIGQGWDAPHLNVLVDLTQATSPVAVQQLRGRSLRLDPADPGKVAHNWDVVVREPGVPGGDNDLRRFVRRHDHLWGVVAGSPEGGAGPPAVTIERGVRHVDPVLAEVLAAPASPLRPGGRGLAVGPVAGPAVPWAESPDTVTDALAAATQRSRRAVDERDATRGWWRLGSGSEGSAVDGVLVRVAEPGVRTAGHTLTVVRPLSRVLAGSGLAAAGVAAAATVPWAGLPPLAAGPSLALAGALAAVPVVAVVAATRRTAAPQPAERTALDVGRAVAAALAEAGLLALDPAGACRSVRVRTDGAGRVVVGLDAAHGDARTFARSLAEVFTVGLGTRYLVRRCDDRVGGRGTTAVWQALGVMSGRAGRRAGPDHVLAVPRALARSRRRAEIFARHWAQHVGGGEVVDLRDPVAATAVLRARDLAAWRGSAHPVQWFGSVDG
jgi:superfamily II DNA or RNA helicase